MTIDTSIFKAYDIRGVYPSQINEENIVAIAKAMYTYFLQQTKKDVLTVVLGCDMRTHSPSLFAKAKEALVSLGAQVIDVGMVPTTAFYYAVMKGNYDCGMQVSASHNPPQYNGMKAVLRDGEKLIKIAKISGLEEVKKMVVEDKFAAPKEGGTVTAYPDAIKDEVDNAIKLVNATHLKPLKVVADAANAMGGTYIEELYKHAPGELVRMNFELDGTFPNHQPDPLVAKNLVDLQKKVLEEHADLGIAPDGDGDRVFFIDEKGQVVPATLTSALIAQEIMKAHPGEKILVDVRYTRNVANMAKKYNGTAVYSQVGHALITKLLNEEHAAFAGESSGHFYFRETGGGESSVRVILTILELLGSTGKTMSELAASVITSIESGEINFVVHEGVAIKDVIDNVLLGYRDGTLSTLDGIAVEYPEWRFSIRSSNTEPLLRLNIEGQTKELVAQKVEEIKSKILALGADLHE